MRSLEVSKGLNGKNGEAFWLLVSRNEKNV